MACGQKCVDRCFVTDCATGTQYTHNCFRIICFSMLPDLWRTLYIGYLAVWPERIFPKCLLNFGLRPDGRQPIGGRLRRVTSRWWAGQGCRWIVSVDCRPPGQGRRIRGFEGARAPPEHASAPPRCQKHSPKMKRKLN